MRRQLVLLPAMILLTLACQAIGGATPTTGPTVFDSGCTAFGFFPTPPEVSVASALSIMRSIGEHADVILIQEPLPWADFLDGVDGDSQKMQDIRNTVQRASQNGLEPVFIVDALQGFDRTRFVPLPPELKDANFGSEALRRTFKNYTLRLAREFHPRYLGLASEINTYLDAHPGDVTNFLSLYRETYQAVKAESPETQVFATFQWEDLNNLGAFNDSSGKRIKWEAVEAFEPELDLWVISTYPFAAFSSAADIPPDYYTPLLSRTAKRLAVAEGGFNSEDVASVKGTPQDQIDYLNAIHNQIGGRLNFWIYLLLDDFNMDSYARALRDQGQGSSVETLRLFSALGLRTFNGAPKPALAVWDSFRAQRVTAQSLMPDCQIRRLTGV